jgi:hypothetical protein
MIYVAREQTRTGFVRALRLAFGGNTDFRYQISQADPNQPAENSGVFIYDSFPWKKIGYPAIIVSLGPGDPLVRTIGGEHWGDNSSMIIGPDGATYANVVSEFYAGGVTNTVIINVYARSSVQRSALMDWVAIYIRFYFPAAFAREGVTVAGMNHGGERQEMVGNDPVYVDSLTVNVYSEFQHTINLAPGGTINAISLVGIFALLNDGATDSGIKDYQ